MVVFHVSTFIFNFKLTGGFDSPGQAANGD